MILNLCLCVGQEAVKDFNSVKMSRWLHAKSLSEEDCEKIKGMR